MDHTPHSLHQSAPPVSKLAQGRESGIPSWPREIHRRLRPQPFLARASSAAHGSCWQPMLPGRHQPAGSMHQLACRHLHADPLSPLPQKAPHALPARDRANETRLDGVSVARHPVKGRKARPRRSPRLKLCSSPNQGARIPQGCPPLCSSGHVASSGQRLCCTLCLHPATDLTEPWLHSRRGGSPATFANT